MRDKSLSLSLAVLNDATATQEDVCLVLDSVPSLNMGERMQALPLIIQGLKNQWVQAQSAARQSAFKSLASYHPTALKDAVG